tara:strand:+ start:379 stop:681 length:303 start_codon:yes stop_codon:yes gene_type:complete
MGITCFIHFKQLELKTNYMYQVTHFRKSLKVEASKPYGVIIIYFGSKTSFKNFGQMSITKFMALSHILENDEVGYDPQKKLLITPLEASEYVKAPKNEIK